MTTEECRNAILVASDPGQLIVPTTLLQAVESQTNPIQALMDWDINNGFHTALQEEFSFFARRSPIDGPLPSGDLARGIGVLRWLIEQLRRWSAGSDAKLARLVTLIVIIESCAWDSTTWFALDKKFLWNVELSDKLATLLSQTKCHLSVNIVAGRASVEEMAIAELRDAEAKADWKALIHRWRRIEHLMMPNPFIVHAVRYLFRHDQAALVRATTDVHSVAVAQLIAEALTVEQRFQLASATSNLCLQLLALETALHSVPRLQKFSGNEEKELDTLLLRMEADDPGWLTFLSIYNDHPSAYQALQSALGKALVVAPEAALNAYIQTVPLAAPCDMKDRLLVASCLDTFRTGANVTRRRLLWTMAFNRWSGWDFERAAGGYLRTPTPSELDFAVVGYLKECVDTTHCIAEQERIEAKLTFLECTWFRSISDLITAWNRLVSRFQLYAHAVHDSSAENWLAESPNYQPSGSDALFASLRFR